MSDLPSVRAIHRATPILRQAYELAIQIEAIDSYADEMVVDQHRRAFQSYIEQIASRLGMPDLTIVASNDEPADITFGR